MNVSGINMYTPSFGQIRKSAAEKAIKETNGNVSKLQIIRDMVDSQKHNKQFDIIASPDDSFGKYQVISSDGKRSDTMLCNDIYDACFIANEWHEETSQEPADKKNIFDTLAAEILAECKD